MGQIFENKLQRTDDIIKRDDMLNRLKSSLEVLSSDDLRSARNPQYGYLI